MLVMIDSATPSYGRPME